MDYPEIFKFFIAEATFSPGSETPSGRIILLPSPPYREALHKRAPDFRRPVKKNTTSLNLKKSIA